MKRLLLKVRSQKQLSSPQPRPRGRYSPHDRDWDKLELFLSPSDRERFDRIRNLLSHSLPDQDPTSAFLKILDEAIERHDPIRKESRAKKQSSISTAASPTQSPDAPPTAKDAGAKRHCHSGTRSRATIPAALRRRTWILGEGRCQYVDALAGRRCESARFLDVDHIVPLSRGGGTTLENLRLLCASHNRNRMKWE